MRRVFASTLFASLLAITFGARADEGVSPPSDSFGSAEYRRELVKVLVRRSLVEALAG